jgi:cell division transport system permease protein
MRQLRILSRVFVETGIGLKRSGWSNWLVVSILAIALVIFGTILQFTMVLKEVVNSWGSQLEISAYLKDNCDPNKIAKVVSQIPDVQVVEIVPKDIAWQEMQTTFKVAAINNPLPNTLHIKVTSANSVEKVALRLKSISKIEHIRYPLKVARSINKFRQFLEIAGVVVTAALTFATLTVIGNTIHLVIQARQQEIEILSLMGVSPWYIKGPLILQGASYGMVASLAATLLILVMHFYVDPYVHSQLFAFMPFLPSDLNAFMLPTFIILLLLGVSVGASGGAWTSGKYIKI